MIARRQSDLWTWQTLLLAGLFCYSSCQTVASTFENKTGQDEGKPRVFSPRMDYDEWTPLGRGDPLKNNPTFDYVPPVLDRVQYWLDSHTTEPSAKRDVLVLGVTAKKTSPKIPEQFLKFVDGPKFTRSNNHQDVSYRNEFTGSTGAEPPKVTRTSSFRNDYRNQNRIQPLPSSYYPGSFYGQKSKPYTMMLPPPLAQKDKIVSFVEPTRQFDTQTEEGPVLQDSRFYPRVPPWKNYDQQLPGKAHAQSLSKFSPNKSPVQTVSQVETIKSVYAPPSPQPTKPKYEGTTAPSISFEKSNLIYQSTQTLSGGWPSSDNGVHPSTPSASISSQTSARPIPDYSRDPYDIDHRVAASSNHEVVVEQNANIIVVGVGNGNEEVVVGQKGMSESSPAPTTTTASSSSVDEKRNAEGESETGQSFEKMHIVVANSPVNPDVETTEAKKGPVEVVMPANYSEKKSNLGQRGSETPETSVMREVATPSVSGDSTKVGNDGASESETGVTENSTMTGAPVFPRQQPSTHPRSTMPPFPSRRPVDAMVAFGHPQTPLSSMMHPQTRPNHATMHFLGSVRPNVGFRGPASMPMFPPMTHMHAPPPPPPPMRSTLDHGAPMHGTPHLMQDFSSVFTVAPVPSTMNAQSIGPEDRFVDRHRSRVPDATTSIFTTPTVSPFLPTVPSTIENSPLASAEAHVRDPEALDRSPPRTMSPVGEKAEEERDDGRKSASNDPSATRPSASPSSQVTTVPNLTTDPIFSHYKQPAKPIRGPMYLIIQGHSKVKTYKPTVSKHGVPVERNEIAESVKDSRLSKFEQFVQEKTRNDDRANAAAIEKKKAEEKARAEKLARVRQSDLMSLVESGFESFTVSPSYSTTENEPRTNSVTAIEINGN